MTQEQLVEVETPDASPDTSPQGKPQKRSSVNLIAIVVALAGLGWGLFEYRQVSNLNTELAKANSLAEQLQQQLANQAQDLKTVTGKLNELARKSLPVSVLFRPTQSGNGLTTFFKNNAPTAVTIGVVLSNPVTGRRREVNLNIPPNGLQSIGEAEGWVFAPGHHIQVTHAEFGTIDYIVPEK